MSWLVDNNPSFDFSVLHGLDIESLSRQEMQDILIQIQAHPIVHDSEKARMAAIKQKELLVKYQDVDIPNATTQTKLQYAMDMKAVTDDTGYADFVELLKNPYLGDHFVDLQRIGKVNGHRIDSALEARVLAGDSPLAKLQLYTTRHEFPYVKKTKYVSDGVMPGTKIAIEVKGRFRDFAESQKYRLIMEQNDIGIFFIFSKRGVECTWATARKDGTKYSLEEWCERQIKAGLNCTYTFEDELSDFVKTEKFRQFYARNTLPAQLRVA